MCIYFLCLCFISGWHLVYSALIYTTNSEFGIFMAISVPISLPHRNAFVSYNYEFNYYQPEHIYKFPPPLMGPDFEDGYLTYETTRQLQADVCHNCTAHAAASLDKDNATKSIETQPEMQTLEKSREKRALSIMSRDAFYIMLKDKLERTGYPGDACLLRLICETNASTLGDANGFLGTLIHIIFSPSSSRAEPLSDVYYQAEAHGKQHQCSAYERDCKENVLDLISAPVEQILNSIARSKL